MKDREYLGTVNAIYLNADYAAVLFEGKVQLHLASTGHIDSSQNRCGRAVRALDLQFGGPEFKSRPYR